MVLMLVLFWGVIGVDMVVMVMSSLVVMGEVVGMEMESVLDLYCVMFMSVNLVVDSFLMMISESVMLNMVIGLELL